MPANPRPKHRKPRLAAATHQWVARHLPVLGVIALGSVLAPASASAHSPRHRARATGQVLESAVPTEAQLSRVVLLAPTTRAVERFQTAHRNQRKPTSELPITPVLLGLLALGLALGSFSYARARHATGKARAPTPLRIRPIRVPHASQAPLGPRGAEHQERQR
jgi:hypothetical protein